MLALEDNEKVLFFLTKKKKKRNKISHFVKEQP